MKTFIEKHLSLHDRAIEKLRGIKQSNQLLRSNPHSSGLLSLKTQLQNEYAEIMKQLTEDCIKSKTPNEITHGVVGLSEHYFEEN